MAHDVFVSYSTKDKSTADAICAALEATGIRCWIAPRDILPGSDWGETIIDAIHVSRAMVLVFSGSSNASSQIKREIERAVNVGIPVVPFRIENVLPSKTLEYFISTQHWLDALTPPLEQHLQYLAKTMRAMLVHKVDGSEAAVRKPQLEAQPEAHSAMPPAAAAAAPAPPPAAGDSGRKFASPLFIGILVLAAAVAMLAGGLWMRGGPPATPPLVAQAPEQPLRPSKDPKPADPAEKAKVAVTPSPQKVTGPVIPPPPPPQKETNRNITGTWVGGLVNGTRTTYVVTQTRNKIKWEGSGKYDGHYWEHTAIGTIRGDEITAYFEDTAGSYYNSKGSVKGIVSEDGNSIYWSGFNPYELRWTRKNK
jgi:hypothetical protein